MTTGIFVVHTGEQAEQANALVDLFELGLGLPEGAILCSSLPGYSLRSGSANIDDWNAAFAGVGTVVALLDERALHNAQVVFELACAACCRKSITLVIDRLQAVEALPWQLAHVPRLLRGDRRGLRSLLEDVAFQLDVAPRVNSELQAALEQFMQGAPEVSADELAAVRYEAPYGVEQAPSNGVSHHHSEEDLIAWAESEFGQTAAAQQQVGQTAVAPQQDDAIPLSDDDFIALEEHELSELATPSVSCELSLEAGRAISECSFHREQGGDFRAELEVPFGRFVDAVGGNWDELRRIADLDVWLGATDNLLQNLPAADRHISDWFELGFQFSTLMSIAEQGLPDEPGPRHAFEEIWQQSMAQFQRSAEGVQLRHTDVAQMQALLENLIDPQLPGDYTIIPRSLEALRQYAAAADAR